MEADRREMRRFPVNLTICGINDCSLHGEIKDFSRRGMCAILNTCSLNEKSDIQIDILRPDYNSHILANASVIWKKPLGEKCEVGLRFKNFPSQAKADILEYGYKKWLKESFLH